MLFDTEKFLIFMKHDLFFLWLLGFKIFAKSRVMKFLLYPTLTAKTFIASALTFRSLIHFDIIFVYAVNQRSKFILLYVDIKLSQHHFWS